MKETGQTESLEYLQKELDNAAEKFHGCVEKFKEELMPEYINISREREAQLEAQKALISLDATRKDVETRIPPKSRTTAFKKLMTTFSEKTSSDMIKYQRAMLIFKRREEEYNNISPLARHFLTPRTRFAKAWEKEEELGRSAHPESNFFVIVFAVVIVLAVIALLLSTDIPPRLSDFSRKFILTAKSSFETVKIVVANPLGMTAREMKNATKLEL